MTVLSRIFANDEQDIPFAPQGLLVYILNTLIPKVLCVLAECFIKLVHSYCHLIETVIQSLANILYAIFSCIEQVVHAFCELLLSLFDLSDPCGFVLKIVAILVVAHIIKEFIDRLRD